VSARGRLTALAYHLADEVVITNSDNLDAARKLKLDNYTFIPHPMNEYWNRTGVGAHLREELQRQFDTDFVIFHPARHYWSRDPLAEQKANHLLIEGFARFIQEVAPRALAIFVEWGTSVDESKALLEALGCQRNVKWVQPMNRANMARYIDASEVVADQFFLGAFGGIPPQALSFGKPTLLKFDAEMHQWCFEEMPPLINVDSSDAIFEELKRLYTDRGYYQQIAQASLNWYPRYHSNQAVTEKTLALYQRALRNREAVPASR
jgi:glycosyltransferase involved in cell wall biosynthesis